MHRNAPLPDKKNQKISGEGARPPSQTPPHCGRGIPHPQTPSARRIRRLDLSPSALGVLVPFHLRLEHCERSFASTTLYSIRRTVYS